MSQLPPIEQQRILAIYAHPDDEVFCSGGTLAKYASLGAEITVISATKGQAGQIHDTSLARRGTLGNIRAHEFSKSCQALGVKHIECWDYIDGQLAQADCEQVVGDIVKAIRKYRPHILITFGPDGAYGHPDHVAICHMTTEACLRTRDDTQFPKHYDDGLTAYQPSRLYYAHFPERRLLLLNQLVKWLTSQEKRFFGTEDYVRGLSIFAEESAMLNYASDHIDTRWFTPGFCILEQGEPAKDLYVILSGTVDIFHEDESGDWTKVDVLSTGAFFGEIGIANHSVRSAHVVACDAVTCLVFSPSAPSNFEARGMQNLRNTAKLGDLGDMNVGDATHVIDVRAFISEKVQAMSAHRTQFAVTPDMFPEDILKALFGLEFFVQVYPKKRLETSL